tara:strand:- start:322 stop:660 length:339 start_codon:yes stop_codon:yes gene_type:complete
MIDYKNWDNIAPRAKTIVDLRWDKKKRKWVPQRNHGTKINPEVVDYPLTELQKSSNIYEPMEAYSEDWIHHTDNNGIFIKAEPVEGTRVRNDLPPLYQQWKTDWKNRNEAQS